MELDGVTVLLVEHDLRYASALESYLRKRGCEICIAASKNEALEVLERRRFDLVLSEFLLSDGTAYELMPPLLGSGTTMFFSNAVEDGCWWMNAIYEGHAQPSLVLLHPTLSQKHLERNLARNREYTSTGVPDLTSTSGGLQLQTCDRQIH
jgi:response regulator RpfG family c-di-GMP phosphodiesterase